MRYRVRLLALLLTAASAASAAAPAPAGRTEAGPGVLPPPLEARYQQLTSELRCPVCQNEPISTSQSQIAAALREIVRQRLLAGESDEKIERYMTSRYGLFALYKPPVERSTFLLWFGPLILLLIAGVVVGRALFKRRKLLRHSDTGL
jgi:cytochrome c-type biogenesis protein CcmH